MSDYFLNIILVKIKSLLPVFFLFATSTSLMAKVEHLLPKPQQITINSGTFNLSRPVQITVPAAGSNNPAIQEELSDLILSGSGTVVSSASASIEVHLVDTIPNAEFQDEAYWLEVTENRIMIKATKLQGAYWATQTLRQLAENSEGNVEACTITDWPAFRLRGYMHDVGRSFIEFDELKNHIAKLSRFKVNTFHWHLTENQGWRLESKVYPQLNANASFTRHAGKFYTIAQAKELVAFARQHGVQVIPEIDMPGHSEAFRKAMGHSMLTDAGLTEMKVIMTEACETFSDVEWMHIGSDEVRSGDTQGATMTAAQFIPIMSAHIRAMGKKIVVWRPGNGYSESNVDMVHMWSSAGSTLGSLPAIDSRLHYINHYDQYADVVSLYNSTIAMQTKGSHQYPGTIIGIWNDRVVPTDRDIIIQNGFYQSMLAMAERAWLGGGKGYFYTIGVKLDPTDMEFADWERRFLFQKANFLKNEPIAYVKQTNVQWKITDPFPNGGNVNAVFPPETSEPATSYTYNGTTYNTQSAYGAGIYLRHVWGEKTIPAFYSSPQTNSTTYAYTHVYSPERQTVGLQLEFQNYGRSEADLAAPQGQWDYYNSKVWINGTAIAPPVWQNTHSTKSNEITLKNENFTARPPIAVTLNEGWNKVLIKLPNNGFSNSAVRLMKWMFTFVFVTPDGKDAVEGLIYSPEKNMNPALDILISALDKANSTKNSVMVGSEPGKYPTVAVAEFQNQIDAASAVRNNPNLSNDEYNAAAELLISEIEQFKKKMNLPLASSNETTIWYTFTALRENRSVSYQGVGNSLLGETYQNNHDKFLWKLVELSDGTYSLVSKASGTENIFISTATPKLTAIAGAPTSGGWKFTPIYKNNYFIISAGTSQFNQGNSGTAYAINNWGNGTNTTDEGCQYIITTRQVTTDVQTDTVDSVKIRIENRLLKSSGDLSKLKAFTVAGQQLDVYRQLPRGIVIVKTNEMALKLMVI